MALPKTGVRLVAEGGPSFLRTLRGASDGVDKFERNTKSASAGTIAFGVAIGNLAAGALTTITGLLIDAGAAAVGFVGGSIQMAGELEAQMSGVAAVMGASNDELQLLNDLVVDLGIDPNLKVSSVEAAQAIEVLAKNGVELDDILNGVARGTVFLANAVGGDFALSADVATDAMNIFNFRADQMGEVVNGVAAVVQSSKFDINDFALALANGGATAANVGVSFQDFNTAIAAISPNFSSGQTAGTGLKNLLLRLVPATEKAEDAMRDLGLITADGANVFFDAEGNMLGMEEIAGELQKALSGLSEEQKGLTLRTIFGQDAMEAALALAAVGADEFGELAHNMAQVDAGEAAATRVNNFAGAMDILDGTIEAVRLQIGDTFLPILTELARQMAVFVEELGPKIIGFFGDAGTFVSTFFLALQLGIGPLEALRVSFSNIISMNTDTLFSKIAETALILFDILDGGRTPVQGIFDALTNLGVTKDVAFAIVDGFIKLRDTFIAVKDFILEHKDAIISALTNIGIAFAIGGIILAVSAAITALLSPMTLLIAGIALLSTAWTENWFGMRDNSIAAMGSMSAFWKQVMESEMPKAQRGFQMIFEELGKDFTTGLAVWGMLFKELGRDWDRMIDDFVQGANFWIGVFASVMEGITNLLAGFLVTIDEIGAAWDLFTTDAAAGWSAFGDIFNQIVGSIISGINSIINAIGQLIEALTGINVPQIITPGSPTPLELGFRGIANSMLELEKILGRDAFLRFGGFGGLPTTGDQLGGGLLPRTSPISPPATGTQIRNATINNTINNSTVNFSGNFAGQPNITDRDMLIETLGTL